MKTMSVVRKTIPFGLARDMFMVGLLVCISIEVSGSGENCFYLLLLVHTFSVTCPVALFAALAKFVIGLK